METKVIFGRIAASLVLATSLTSCTKFDPLYVLPDICKLFDDIPTIELPPSLPPPPIQGSCSKMSGK